MQHVTDDERDRLTHAFTTGGTAGSYDETDGYDPTGNLTSKGGTPYSYPTVNQPHPHAPTSVGGVAFSYDANGNTLNDATRSYTWNAQNLPLSITVGGSPTSGTPATVAPTRTGPSLGTPARTVAPTRSGASLGTPANTVAPTRPGAVELPRFGGSSEDCVKLVQP